MQNKPLPTGTCTQEQQQQQQDTCMRTCIASVCRAERAPSNESSSGSSMSSERAAAAITSSSSCKAPPASAVASTPFSWRLQAAAAALPATPLSRAQHATTKYHATSSRRRHLHHHHHHHRSNEAEQEEVAPAELPNHLSSSRCEASFAIDNRSNDGAENEERKAEKEKFTGGEEELGEDEVSKENLLHSSLSPEAHHHHHQKLTHAGAQARKELLRRRQNSNNDKIKYWHYKQTGVRSRPIKLLKHPIEHIERKIILTFLLSILFKLIAILTGPLIVLIVYLITVPFTICRRFIWFLLNLPCGFLNARIKTTTTTSSTQSSRSCCSSSSSSSSSHKEHDDEDDAQLNWKYCPLDYLESYWFRERLINTIILVINHDNNSSSSSSSSSQDESEQQIIRENDTNETSTKKVKTTRTNHQVYLEDSNYINRLRSLIRDEVLAKPEYRKFLCRVVSRGIPFYKSHYWHYLGLSEQQKHLNSESKESNNIREEDDKQNDDVEYHKNIVQPQQSSSKTVASAADGEGFGNREKDKIPSSESQPSAFGNAGQIREESPLSIGHAQPATNLPPPSLTPHSLSSSSLLSQQFSTTTAETSCYESLSQPNVSQEVRIHMQPCAIVSNNEATAATTAATTGTLVDLSSHVFIDRSLSAREPQVTLAAVRRHAHRLMSSSAQQQHQLNPDRPLWEIRVIRGTEAPCSSPSSRFLNKLNDNSIQGGNRKTYLIFRCHQCLADGKSLSRLLTDNLTQPQQQQQQQQPPISLPPNTFAPSGGRTNGENKLPKCNDYNSKQQPQQQQDEDFSIISKINNEQQEEEQEQEDYDREEQEEEEKEKKLKPLREKRSFIARVSKSSSFRGAICVGPLTVLLWIIWSFTRRRNYNHLKRCSSSLHLETSEMNEQQQQQVTMNEDGVISSEKNLHTDNEQMKKGHNKSHKSDDEQHSRRFYMTQYDLTRFYQIKQMTRSTVSDIILCALSGAMRNYLSKFNGVSNPPNLNACLAVDMRQSPALEQLTCQQQQQQQIPKCAIANKNGASSAAGDAQPAKQMLSKLQQQSRETTQFHHQVHYSSLSVSLATSIEGTVPRLWETRNTMDELRASADAWVMVGLKKLLFKLLPHQLYCWLINYISLRNCSAFVSNFHGPATQVESWCVDLFQRALWEAQQQTGYKINTSSGKRDSESKEAAWRRRRQAAELRSYRRQLNQLTRLKFRSQLGQLEAIYYCMEPPSGDIPISFNCITYHNRLFVTCLSRSLLVEDSKLLIRLFFKQLDQLANTIAKRRSLITIIRSPQSTSTLPSGLSMDPLLSAASCSASSSIEISCQPASPVGFASVHSDFKDDDDDNDGDNELRSPSTSNQPQFVVVGRAATDAKRMRDTEISAAAGDDDEDNEKARSGLLNEEAAAEERALRAFSPPLGQVARGPKVLARRRQSIQGIWATSSTTTNTSCRSLNSSSSGMQPQPSARRTSTPQLFLNQQQQQSLVQRAKDEASGRATQSNKCVRCKQFVCSCRRRKSLFSFDNFASFATNSQSKQQQQRQQPARSFNLLVNQLQPSYSLIVHSVQALSGSGSNRSQQEMMEKGGASGESSHECLEDDDEEEDVAGADNCTCSKLYLSELEEDVANANARATIGRASSETNSRSPSARSINQLSEVQLKRQRQQQQHNANQTFQHRHSSTPKPPCYLKSQSADRSSLSLNLQGVSSSSVGVVCEKHQLTSQERRRQPQQQQQQHGSQVDSSGFLQAGNTDYEAAFERRRSNVSMDEAKRRVAATLGHLVVPQEDGSMFGHDKLHSKAHSKSETDLPTTNLSSKKISPSSSNNQKGLRDSWFNIGRKSNEKRKHSLFSRANFLNQQQSTSSRSNTLQSSSTLGPAKKSRFMDAPVETIYRHLGDSLKRRRRSLATTSGTISSHQRSFVIKDETNADVNLRYNLDSPFFSIRARRFSTIGSVVVSNQRRTSLIPFGLMHNNSFPKLFYDDSEAHL